MKTRVLDIVRGTTVDGPGLRTSIYFAGCRHQCPGCHNKQSWDFNAGKEMTLDELMEVVREEDFDVTLSGGDPLYQPEFVAELCRKICAEGHTVWIYTGFLWEEILANSLLKDAVRLAETVVEGPFVEALKSQDLLFRGSSNQRLMHPATDL